MSSPPRQGAQTESAAPSVASTLSYASSASELLKVKPKPGEGVKMTDAYLPQKQVWKTKATDVGSEALEGAGEPLPDDNVWSACGYVPWQVSREQLVAQVDFCCLGLMVPHSNKPQVPVILRGPIEETNFMYQTLVTGRGFPPGRRIGESGCDLSYVVGWDYGAHSRDASRLAWGYSFAQCVLYRAPWEGCLNKGWDVPMPNPTSSEGRSFLFYGRYGHKESLGESGDKTLASAGKLHHDE